MKLIITLLLFSFSSLYSSNECIDLAHKKFKENKFEESIAILNECSNSILEDEDPLAISKMYYGLGLCYYNIGNYEKALKYQLLSYDIKKKFSIKEKLNLNFNGLGVVYQKIGLYEKSIYYFNKAIELNQKSSLTNLSYNYNNIANSYEELGLLDTAEYYYNLCLGITKNNNSELTYKVYNNLAFIFDERNDYDNAFNLLSKSKGIKNFDENLFLKHSVNLQVLNIKYGKDFDKKTITEFYNKFNSSKIISYKSYSNFCMSLVLAIEGKTNESIALMSKAVNGLQKNGFYRESLDYIDTYLGISHSYKLDQTPILPLQNKRILLFESSLKQMNIEYAKDLEIINSNEKFIEMLSNDLSLAQMNNYLLIALIFLILFSTNFGYKWIKRNRLMKSLEQHLLEINNDRIKTGTYAINNLGKLMYMIDLRLSYEENSKIFDTIDETIEVLNDKNRNKDSDIQLTNKEL